MFTIGVDLGGTNIAVAIVDEKGNIVKKGSVPTLSSRSYDLIIKDMGMLCVSLIEVEGLTSADIESVGIGSPGIADSKNGILVYNNNLNFKDVPMAAEFQKYLNVPVYIGNDANVAAYGEYISGAGAIYSDLVAITLGTGVGGGVIIGGNVIEGSFFAGAELGHIVISVDGELCTCGRHGCWETYSSATALIREAKKSALANPDSMMNQIIQGDMDNMNAKIPFDAAQAGDAVAGGVVDSYIKYLAIGLVNVVNIFQPEVIVLGGGVSAQKENLIQPLLVAMEHEIYGGKEAFKTKIKVAELGNDAGVIGAAMLHKLHE
ncbi:MAG: ROK family protein [Vallitaleaceae bacterium]|jgi:glucokinase|nr:ROK family protein [Vallitaleaceae bacterium]